MGFGINDLNPVQIANKAVGFAQNPFQREQKDTSANDAADAAGRAATQGREQKALDLIGNAKPVSYNAYGAPAQQMQAAQANPELMAQRAKFMSGQRDELNRQNTAAGQQADDAINRRFASMGASNSGAALQAQLGAQRELGMNRAAQENQLNNQELQFQQAAEESQLGRDQQANSYNTQLANQIGMANTDLGNKATDMNQQLDLARAQALLDANTTQFNKELALKEYNKPGPGLFGQGGFLGLGLSNGGDSSRIF